MNDYLQNMKKSHSDKSHSPKTRKNFDNTHPYSANSRFNTYGSNYRNSRGPNAKRSSGSGVHGEDQSLADDNALSSMLIEALSTLNKLIDKILKTQDDMITVQERNSDMLERQAAAMEGILEYLNCAPVSVFEKYCDMFEQQDIEADDMLMQETETEADFPDLMEMENLSASPKSEIAQKTSKKSNKKSEKKSKKTGKTKKAKSAKSKKESATSRELVLDMIDNMRKKGATYAQIAQHLIESKLPTFSGRGVWHAQTIHRLYEKNKELIYSSHS